MRESELQGRTAVGAMTRAAKAVIASSACVIGAPWLVRTISRRAAGGRNVLFVMYHLPTGGEPDPALLQSLCISAPTLRKQLEHLGRLRDIVSIDDAVRELSRPGRAAARRGGRPDLAVVTFDDGYAGVHEHALPVLAQLRVPAIAYVATGFVGSPHRLLHDRLHACLTARARRSIAVEALGLAPRHGALLSRCARPTVGGTLNELIASVAHDELAGLAAALEERLGVDELGLPSDTRIMTWQQLGDLKAAGVDVGGHTVHHVDLANVPLPRARAEIVGCRDDIAAHLGFVPRHFCYPNCYYTEAVRREVAAAGFITAVTGANSGARRDVDLLTLRRRSVCEASTLGLRSYSTAMATCHFSELFGALGLQRTIAYERPDVVTPPPDVAGSPG